MPVTYLPRRNTAYDGKRRYIINNDSASGHHRTLSNFYPLQDRRPRTNPNIVTNLYRLANLAKFFRLHVVPTSDQHHTMRY